jgi:hypothetical protein
MKNQKADLKNKKTFDKKKIALIVDTVCITLIAFMLMVGSCVGRDIIRWNEGKHFCGGNWEYTSPINHIIYNTHLYTCDKCGVSKEFMYNWMK